MNNIGKTLASKIFNQKFRQGITLPKTWKTNTIATLLCICFKMLEPIVYNRIASTIHPQIPNDQAGFMPKRCCCEKVLALTTHIEAGFQDKLWTAVVFVDLSSAFDTVWRNTLLLKLTKVVQCKKKQTNLISSWPIDSLLEKKEVQRRFWTAE